MCRFFVGVGIWLDVVICVTFWLGVVSKGWLGVDSKVD